MGKLSLKFGLERSLQPLFWRQETRIALRSIRATFFDIGRDMTAGIVVFPGINRERDMAIALERSAGRAPRMIWHTETDLSGLDLVDQIRNSDASPNKMTPIIIMTGYSARPRIESARDTGVTEFLVKPFSASDLARRISHVIKKPRDFIEAEGFFGPDRRRHRDENYPGPHRRSDDHHKN